MADPFKLACHCGFSTAVPQEFLDHCLVTKHIDVPDVTDGSAAEELGKMFAMIQQLGANPDMELPEGMELNKVSEQDILDDDELTDEEKQEVLGRLAEVKKLHDASESTPSITCPRCGAVSFNPTDIAQRYCGRCHAFHEDL